MTVEKASIASHPSFEFERLYFYGCFSVFAVQFGTKAHKAAFTIKIRFGTIPKLYYSGPQKGEFDIVSFIYV